MDLQRYLKRIGIEEVKVLPTLENLKLLQRQHLQSIPFENLDIHWNRPIILDVDKFYKKIVGDKRGGFCYELNGLFNELLREIGYKTKIISARVSNDKGGFGKEYDHLAILAKIGAEEYLVDVGFGDFIAEPLKLNFDDEQEDDNGIYMIRKFDDEYFEVVKRNGDDWQSEYIFTDVERNLTEFEEMNDFHQTAESHFSKGKICSLMTKNGRKTLTDKTFSMTLLGKKIGADLPSSDEFTKILKVEFGIEK